MDQCCQDKSSELAVLRAQQGRVLQIALGINLVMFVVEFTAGVLASSTALLGDSLDMFGDASVYALTLYTLHRSDRARAGANLAKGTAMLLIGCAVIVQAVRNAWLGIVPEAHIMGTIGVLALAANALCFALIYRHRSDDLNMRSSWLCSRNDLIANTSVIAAAGLVVWSGSLWPDLVVGVAIAALFLSSAWHVLWAAGRDWRHATP
ncbi:MAG: cation transporter [Gammaproteobacteria bacterium]|nr:cation transporter [Gammaproteobacteria bacterium]